jgi:hypothetical protein
MGVGCTQCTRWTEEWNSGAWRIVKDPMDDGRAPAPRGQATRDEAEREKEDVMLRGRNGARKDPVDIAEGFIHRVELIYKGTGLKKKKSFAALIGIHEATFYRLFKGTAGEPAIQEIYHTIIEKWPEVNPEWLRVGEAGGTMLMEERPPETPEADDGYKPYEEQDPVPKQDEIAVNILEKATDALKQYRDKVLGNSLSIHVRKTVEEYAVEGDDGRFACITFGRSDSGRMVFSKCDVDLNDPKTANYEDWLFLGAVSREIQALQEKKDMEEAA